MNCRDVRQASDSCLHEALPTEALRQILRHLEVCQSCRTEIEGRRRLRGALRAAFNRAPSLRPRAGFSDRLHDELREAAALDDRSRTVRRGWIALAAGLLLAAALFGAVFSSRSLPAADALARDAIGDHRNCALTVHLVRKAVPLEEAAQRFDRAYRLLLSAPPDLLSTPSGPVRVVDRHSCTYGARRFGHVVLEYRGRIVSLLMTATDGTAGAADSAGTIPRLIGRRMNGLSVVSVDESHHAILLVGDLERDELAALSKVVSVPLAQRLEAGRTLGDRSTLAALRLPQPPEGKT